ncbi:MAG: hypothetical protein IAF38_09180 [Bacteroidia bacterium]|nr:hypothetical protein [Bacteroidia bacterium]
MYYVSPFTLLGITEVSNARIERKDLQLAKKKMLAEIELSDSQTVKINEKEFNKDEILKIFEELEDEKVIEYHRIIAQDKAFILFLEKGFISDYNNLKKTPETENSDFMDFVSPYYRERFEPELNKLFKAKDFFNLTKLLKTNRFMNMSDEEACFKKVYEEINERIEKIDELNAGIRSKRLFGITVAEAVFYSRNYLGAISLLPDFFMELRNRLAKTLIILYVEAYNVLKRPDISGEIIRNLSGLKVDDDMRAEVRRRELEYSNASESAGSYTHKSTSSSGSGRNPVVAILVVALIIIKILFFSKACGGRSHRSDYNFPTNYNYNYNPPVYDRSSTASNTVDEFEKNKNLFSFLDSVYSSPSVLRSGSKINRLTGKTPVSMYDDILTWNKNANFGMIDTGKLVFYNNSDFELCVILSSASGARAWYIPQGDSVLALSRDKNVNVYYTAGSKLESKKKFKVSEYDNNMGIYQTKAIPVKTFKTSAEDAEVNLRYPTHICQTEVSKDILENASDNNKALIKALASLGSRDLGIYNYRKKIIFYNFTQKVEMNVRDESSLKSKFRSLTNSRTP